MNWRWLPRVRTCRQPSDSIKRITSRTFTRTKQLGETTVLLRECDRLSFVIGQRTPVGNTMEVYTNATPGQQQGLWVDQITAFCEGLDSGAGIALW